jgi:hypothetical protein
MTSETGIAGDANAGNKRAIRQEQAITSPELAGSFPQESSIREATMLGIEIVWEKPDIWRRKRDVTPGFGLRRFRLIGVDAETGRFEIVSCRRDAAEDLLAKRNRHHTLAQDNPSSD